MILPTTCSFAHVSHILIFVLTPVQLQASAYKKQKTINKKFMEV